MLFIIYTLITGNIIDTANRYQEGQSEEWLGEFIKNRDNRENLVSSSYQQIQ